MTKKDKKSISNSWLHVLVGVGILIIAGVVIYVVLMYTDESPDRQSRTCTTYNGTIEEQCTEDYIGLSIDKAASKAEENDLYPKTIKRDGEAQGFTDFGGTPIYFEVEDDIVTEAYFEGGRPQ